MTKINYKSDFDFIANLKALGADGTEVEIGFPSYDFEAVLTTDCSGYNKHYVASQKNGVTTNCFNDNGKLHIVCDNHKLSVGELKLTFNTYLPNNIYPDGSQKVVADYDMNIELVVENTDVNSAEVDVLLPFFYDSAYRQAVIAGYKGTQEEYFALASQLPNAVETANKVQASADSLANSAEQIGDAIETLGATTEAIEQGANVIKDNADTLQESATIVKTSAEQIGANIADLQESVSSIDGAVEDINKGASTIANSATKVETSATTLEDVSATISGSASSLAESANTIKSSADALQENADKVGASATAVEQAVEPLVQASESLDATKQAFEMLSSEWADGRQAIATALTNRRYPTEPTESFHAMAEKVENMSYEEGWFAKIGYTDEYDGGIKDAIDYSYELAKGWNPDGSTASMFSGNKRLKFLPNIDFSNVSMFTNIFMNCASLVSIPHINAANADSLMQTFYGCIALESINISNARASSLTSTFYNCQTLTSIKQIDMSLVTSMISTFYQCDLLVYVLFLHLGKSTLTTYNFSSALNWGTNGEENRQSLIDSLITYSYDRASNGMVTATIKLSANTKALLTDDEIAQITAKGFTIS